MWLGIFKPNLVCKFFTKDHTCRFENNPFLYSWMFFFLFRDLGLLSNRTGISAFEIWERLVAGIEAIKVVIQSWRHHRVKTCECGSLKGAPLNASRMFRLVKKVWRSCFRVYVSPFIFLLPSLELTPLTHLHTCNVLGLVGKTNIKQSCFAYINQWVLWF